MSVDLYKYMDKSLSTSTEQEQELWQAFFDGGVYLAAGKSYHFLLHISSSIGDLTLYHFT